MSPPRTSPQCFSAYSSACALPVSYTHLFCFEGKWYRPEDLFRKKVLGKFPKVADDVLIPMQWIEAVGCRNRTRIAQVPFLLRGFLGQDVAVISVFARNIKASALCGLGQSAPNPVLSTLKYFRDEYVAHVVDKKCPAGVCVSMVKFIIDDDTCKRCGICKRGCPTQCISGDKDTPFAIDQDKCVKCGLCMEKCPFKAILKNA